MIYDPEQNRLLVLKFEDHHVFRLLKGGVEKHETNRMALRREIREETGLTEYSIIGAVGTYAYLHDKLSHLVNVYLVECSMFDGEASPISRNDGDKFIKDVCWIKVKDAVHSLMDDERAFVMKALDIPVPPPVVQVIETARKPVPAIHFLKRLTTYPRPSLPATLSGRPRPR